MMFSFRPVLKSLALLVVLAPLSSVAAQQEEENSTQTSLSDDNNDSSLMTNFNAMREEGQGFYLGGGGSALNEKPGVNTSGIVGLHWWCDFEFVSDNATNNYGYVGRGVGHKFSATLEEVLAKGGLVPLSKKKALSVSAVLVPSLGIFEGQVHPAHDDWVNRFWDDGSVTLQRLGWEGHDEGDTNPNSDTSAFSASGTYTKITTEVAAELLGMDVADMTPAICSKQYEEAWNATHVPDPIDTSVTKLEEEVAQLQADNKELLSRIAAIEGSLTASGSDSSDDGDTTSTSSSLFTAWYEHDTTSMDTFIKAITTVAVIIGLF